MMKNSNKRSTNESIITDRRNRVLDRQGMIRLLFRIVLLVLVFWLLFSYVFIVTAVSGNEMFPAIKDGDVILGFRFEQDYTKDDVVIYNADGETHIGRIAALASDVVTIDESGTLIVNGTVQSGEIMYPTYIKDNENIEYPYRVPDGCVFILGDYRTQAADSRDFGAIALRGIQGKVITFLRRRGI